MLKQVKLGSLADFNDGKLAAAFDHHLRLAFEDVNDRPGEKKARKVTLQVEVVPIVHQDGATTDCQILAQVKSTVPTHVTAPVTCQLRQSQKGSMAVWNDLAEDNPDQMTIDEIGGGE